EVNPNNIFVVRMLFATEPGDHDWQFGIKNCDTSSSRTFVWVVSDTRDGTKRPWIDVEPRTLSFNANVGETASDNFQQIAIANRRTMPVNIVAGTPASSPYVIAGLPASLNPNQTASGVKIGFNAASAVGPGPAKTFSFQTQNEPQPPADDWRSIAVSAKTSD